MNRLAAAHRSAVRALQMFVNHAPLYFDMNHGLPPMYQELALLIRQLSLLSSNFELGKDMTEFDIDLLPRTKVSISIYLSMIYFISTYTYTCRRQHFLLITRYLLLEEKL